MPAWSLGAFKAPPYRRARIRQLEIMDEPGLDPALRAEALKGIEIISHWWGQRAPLLSEIMRILGPPGPHTLRLVELGAGSGHLSRWIGAQLAQRGYQAEVQPTDILPSPGVKILDCLNPSLPQADLYFSSLLLHHLGDWQACRMLAAQHLASRLGWVHFDLQRHRLHYEAAKILTRLAGLHPINLADALLSIQQGYTRAELQGLLKASGLSTEIRWTAPFRWLLSCKK